jgi:hypothetical protein
MVDAVYSRFEVSALPLENPEDTPIDFQAQKAATAAGYPPIKPTDKLPNYDQYVKIEGISPNELRFTYRDGDREVKRSVFKDATPEQFAEVDKAKGIIEDTVGTAAAKGWQLPKADWKVPPLRDIEKIETTNEIDGQKAYLLKVKGDDKPYLVTEGLHPDAYKAIGERQNLQTLLKTNKEEGYESFDDANKLPPLKDYIRFSYDDEEKRGGKKGIAFEYKDESGNTKKGIVHEDLDKAAFDKVKGYRDAHDKTQKWLKDNNVSLADDKFQLYDLGHVKSVTKVNDLGQEAFLIEQDVPKRNDKGEITGWTGKTEKKLVVRGAVSDDIFKRVSDYEQHDERLKMLEEKVHQKGRGGIWTKAKWDTSKHHLSAIAVSNATKVFESQGILMVTFADNNNSTLYPYQGQTLIFSEKNTPEAYDIIRTYINTGKNKMGNLLPPAKLDRGSIEVMYGKDFVKEMLGEK